MNLVDHSLVKAVANAVGGDEGNIVVGVSGGADSVALLRGLQMARPHPRQIVVAHLDHQLRSGSAEEATWVQRLAMSLDRQVVLARRDVARVAREEGIGLEEAARQCRYDFLGQVAAERNCPWIAIAHTADDQAETVLHHLVRGTGLPGLRGMPVRRPLRQGTLIRPLLGVSRVEVVDFLQRLDQPFLTDKTNFDLAHTRNRIRHSLLPTLREQFNPRVETALVRLVQQVKDVQDLVDELAENLLQSALKQSAPDRALLDVMPLRCARRHLVREALRRLFAHQDWPRGRMGFDAWDQLAALAQTAHAPKSLTLPQRITARYGRGVLSIERA